MKTKHDCALHTNTCKERVNTVKLKVAAKGEFKVNKLGVVHHHTSKEHLSLSYLYTDKHKSPMS